MADSEPSSEQAQPNEPSTEQAQPKWLSRLRHNPVIVTLVVAVAAIAALNGILDFPQRAEGLWRTLFPVTTPVQFNDLNQITIPRFGVTFSYPSDWDRGFAPTNGDGATYVDPADQSVTITGYGSFLVLTPNDPTIYGAVKVERMLILEQKRARIIDATASGAFTRDASGYHPVDGWRAVYQYVDDHGHSMTAMEKLAVADGREVALVMEAPTSKFPRYSSAFLDLSSKLLLTRCYDCASG